MLGLPMGPQLSAVDPPPLEGLGPLGLPPTCAPNGSPAGKSKAWTGAQHGGWKQGFPRHVGDLGVPEGGQLEGGLPSIQPHVAPGTEQGWMGRRGGEDIVRAH